jgi:uncharacterized repeat protein (TIGR02543 family)
MVFYAQWLDGSTPQFTVTFNANGAAGGAAPAPPTVYSGISITVPGQGTLMYSGKTFGGWNTQANGGGTNYAVGAMFTVTGHVTLYAKWQSVIQYTVTYHANGASGAAPPAQTVDPGTEITLPGAGSMTNLGKTFDGWNTQANGGGTDYAEGSAYTVNANASFYAQWVSAPIEPPGATLVEKLAYIRNNAGDGVVYDIVVNSNEYIGPQTVGTMGRNITVIIHSANSVEIKTIQLENFGSLFSVDNNIILILQNITLKGISINNMALVTVSQGGKLILNSNSKITMNTNNDIPGTNKTSTGGGIYVNSGILEINEGAEIIGNKSFNGGGIFVQDGGNVTIRGGMISENRSEGSHPSGGGIWISANATVTMSGGIISKNYTSYLGGGIFIEVNGRFIKRVEPNSSNSGIIYGSIGENANAASSGNALYRRFSSLKVRNSTLGYYDEISSLSDEGWE